ncbi:MAG: hypothetical protein K2H66_02950 [Oscillospiraceae bacterium]|nr:hypothetical protein [Oscillospiraceae bacterium]
MKSKLQLAILMILLFCTGCSVENNNDISILNQNQSVDATEEATKPEVPEGAIADESGDFVYAGKLQPIGNSETGYMQIPLGYTEVQSEDVLNTFSGMVQYCDATGVNMITLGHYEDISYQVLAENRRYALEEQEEIEGLSGSIVTVAGYHALQLYCHHTDGIFLTSWMIEDPKNSEDCYFMEFEFDSDHQNILACSSTFQTVQDYKKSQKEQEIQE